MSSVIPSAVPQFITIARGVMPQDAFIWFGRQMSVFSAPLTLQVISVTGDQEPADLGPEYRREETFEIHCVLTAFAGDDDHPSRMREVFDQFKVISIAVASNYTLNNTVRFAEVGDFNYLPDNDSSGKSIGSLAFQIRCSQRITSLT